MPRELINANITHVSYVDKGANKKQFFLTKSADKPDFQKEVKVFVNKADEDAQQLVYGVVYEPDAVDSHDDFMTATEIEKAAHGFMKDARNIDTQHDFEAGVGEVVESYIAPVDMTIGEEEIVKGSWVLVTKASNEIWEAIQKGEFTGYSLAGTAETIEKQQKVKPVSKSDDDAEMKGFFALLKNFFTGEKIQKGEVRDRYEDNQKRRNLWAVWDGMESTYYDSMWDNRTPDVADFERLEAGVQDFLEILQEIKSSGDIAKALEEKPETIRKGEDEMKAEDIKKAVDEALAPINEKLAAMEKELNPEEPAGQGGVEGVGDENAELMKQFTEVIKNAVSPLNVRLEAVEKARGISKQADTDHLPGQQGQPIQKGYMRHFGA
ncbi:terminase [Sporosarcina sp. P37]|uniref:XkdF-like putative serine protease domain-containing protein n=1 Tax=unclassified Sporosarcina TaxID=2647733 RepID=UPI000A17B69C|nr:MULTISPECIES: XkdF-like putative serine protease domain-containing protein [unclassified Sporosarcina]ARK23303.1 terminase [Sporosarcina sp. P37]PID19555.1 terminase [Sporosarcina sp. P35]